MIAGRSPPAIAQQLAIASPSASVGAEELAALLTAAGRVVTVHQECGKPDDCQRFIDEEFVHVRVDVLVNNAGITVDKIVRRMTVDDWHAVLRVNPLRGDVHDPGVAGAPVQRWLRPDHQHQFGRGRDGCLRPGELRGLPFGAVRADQEPRVGGGRKRITVNCVASGYIGTDMVAAVPPHVLERYLEQIPIGGIGRPDEAASVVEFLPDENTS